MNVAWRRAVRARAIDITAETARRSCLVLAPHPDDETLGCGATIARKLAGGAEVRVVIATDGRYSHRSDQISPDQLAELRAAETAEACARLGLPPSALVLLGHEELTLEITPDLLVGEILEQLNDARPDEILVTSRWDWHPDHRALARVARAAAYRADAPCTVAEYPIWLWADGPWKASRASAAALRRGWRSPWLVRPELVSTDGFLETKRHALDAYRTQLSNLTGEPGWATLDRRFLARFLAPYELFVDRVSSRAGRAGGGGQEVSVDEHD